MLAALLQAIKASADQESGGKEPSCPYFRELDYILNPRENSQPPELQPLSGRQVVCLFIVCSCSLLDNLKVAEMYSI